MQNNIFVPNVVQQAYDTFMHDAKNVGDAALTKRPNMKRPPTSAQVCDDIVLLLLAATFVETVSLLSDMYRSANRLPAHALLLCVPLS
jgi:hypothetical protein